MRPSHTMKHSASNPPSHPPAKRSKPNAKGEEASASHEQKIAAKKRVSPIAAHVLESGPTVHYGFGDQKKEISQAEHWILIGYSAADIESQASSCREVVRWMGYGKRNCIPYSVAMSGVSLSLPIVGRFSPFRLDVSELVPSPTYPGIRTGPK